MDEPVSEFDGPWKEALDLYFRPFIELLFPPIGDAIDWERPIEFLDTELQKIAPEADAGRGSVDKLVRVWAKTGLREEVFVHVEVQSQKDLEFAHRMYRYNHRLENRYGRMPASLAVLGDDDRWWRPSEYSTGRWGCGLKFYFPIVKLVDYLGRERELEEHPNVFAAFVLAHLKTSETRGNVGGRLHWKLRIVKRLYDRGMSRVEIRKLFRLVDWVMGLPAPEATSFRQEMIAFEKEKQMPFVTSTEQVCIDEGLAKGLTNGIEVALDIRFGAEGVALMPRIRQIGAPAVLEQLLRASKSVPDLDAFRNLLFPQPQA